MNNSEINLLKILHKDSCSVQGLSHEEWKDLYDEARKHAVMNEIGRAHV